MYFIIDLLSKEQKVELICLNWAGSEGKEFVCNAGGLGSISELERSPGEGNGNPLKYSCLENSLDRVAWWAVVPGIAESWT